MAINFGKLNPFYKSYDVRCPDQSVKTVYKNANDAFPLSVNGFDGKISANMKAELVDEIGGDAQLATKVDALLFGLDDINNGLMISFRAVYVGYQSDPCLHNEYLLRQIDRINQEQERLRALQLQIRGFVAIATDGQSDPSMVAKEYAELMKRIGFSHADSEGVVEAITDASEAAKEIEVPGQ